MASPLGHALAGAALCAVLAPSAAPVRRLWPWALAILAACAADLDFLPGLLVGVPGRFHHWASHSLLAAAVVGLGAAALGPRALGPPAARGALLGAAYASHLLLDWLTLDRTEPRGIPLLWPWAETPFAAPRPLLPDIWHGAHWEAFVNWHNAGAMLTEAAILGLPALLLCAWRLDWRPRVGGAAVPAGS